MTQIVLIENSKRFKVLLSPRFLETIPPISFLDLNSEHAGPAIYLIEYQEGLGSHLKAKLKKLTPACRICLFHSGEKALTSIIEAMPPNQSLQLLDQRWPQELQTLIVERSIREFLTPKNELKELGHLKQDILLSNRALEEGLAKLKRIHELYVPLRKLTVQGLEVLGKFVPGELPGGDFFDFSQKKNHLVTLLCSTNSYILTSVVITEFTRWMEHSEIDAASCASLVKNLKSSIKKFAVEPSSVDVQLMITFIDLKSLNVEGYHFGKHLLITDHSRVNLGNDYPVDEQFVKNAHFSFKLNRGEKMCILSSGFRRNCQDVLEGKDLGKVVMNLEKSSSRTILNKLFFSLKKDRQEDTLSHDASGIVIKVNKNAIFSV